MDDSGHDQTPKDSTSNNRDNDDLSRYFHKGNGHPGNGRNGSFHNGNGGRDSGFDDEGDHPGPRAFSRTEEWLRTHEEWAAPNDDLRAKVIRRACTAQVQATVQATEQAQEKNRSQWILGACIISCAVLTWVLQDSALGLHDPQASALVAAADDGWLRPVDVHTKILAESGTGFTYDWAVVQAQITWRTLLYQRFMRVLYE